MLLKYRLVDKHGWKINVNDYESVKDLYLNGKPDKHKTTFSKTVWLWKDKHFLKTVIQSAEI